MAFLTGKKFLIKKEEQSCPIFLLNKRFSKSSYKTQTELCIFICDLRNLYVHYIIIFYVQKRTPMNSKLTLKLNKGSIERAKRYAKKHNQSLSVLVEKYFNLISEKEKNMETEISPNVMELSGIIKLDKDYNIKSEYGKYIEEKYGKK